MNESWFLMLYYTIYFLLLATVIKLTVLEYRKNNIAFLFWMTVLFIYVVPSFLDPFIKDGTVENSEHAFYLANNSVLLKAHTFALLFSLTYLFTTVFIVGKNKRTYSFMEDLKKIRKNKNEASVMLTVLVSAAVLGVMSSLYSLYSAGGGAEAIMNASFTNFRLETNANYTRLGYYLMISVSGAVFLSFLFKKWFLMGVFIFLNLCFFFLSFSRTSFSYMFMPFLILLVYKYRSATARLVFVSMLPVMYVFTIFLLLLRYQGSFMNLADVMLSGNFFNDDFFLKLFSEGAETQLRFVYYYFMDGNWRSDLIITGHNYLRLLMLLIPPEYSMGLKPELLDNIAFRIFFAGNPLSDLDGATLPSLMFGDAFLNFGWAGILLGSFWALMVNFWSGASLRFPPLVRLLMVPPTAVGAIIAARGQVYNACAIIFGSFMLVMLYHLVARALSALKELSQSGKAPECL